ncbi:MAG: ABC transporter permease [Alphaproteobacteria bacterium]|nr:ABC transporter permease [Alphaproteobacteria bacterium]
MRAIGIIGGKVIGDALRNRWIVGATVLLAGLAFVLSFLGAAPGGHVGVSPLAVIVVSLSSLSIFLVPLIALLMAYDAVVGEDERGTMLLLLTYPVTKRQILFGKFLGHTATIAIAVFVGYGAAGLANGIGREVDAMAWAAFGLLMISSVLLGMVFLALAYLASIVASERGTAAGLAVGVWLLFVILYDMGLLGLLVASEGRIGTTAFQILLLANPADVFRLLNLSSFENVRLFAGMAGASGEAALPFPVLAAALLAWVAVPLGAAAHLFGRREL